MISAHQVSGRRPGLDVDERFAEVFGWRRGHDRAADLGERWWAALPEVVPGRRDLVHFLDDAAIAGLRWVSIDGEVSIGNDCAATLVCAEPLDREPARQRRLTTDQLLAFVIYWPQPYQRLVRDQADPRWHGWLCDHDLLVLEGDLDS